MVADEEGDDATEPTTHIVGSSGGPACPYCEAALFKRHCKYVCPQHGVIVDCSDPFL